MTVHAPVSMSKEAFLAWVEQTEGRYEYAGGRVTMMVYVTRNHAIVSGNLFATLKAKLNFERYDVATESFAVEVGTNIRFPDVVVEPAQQDGAALRAKAPLVIAEVLSPATLHLDFGDKRREYLSIPTLETYVVVSPDEPRIWLWRRSAGEFSTDPEIVEGLDKTLGLTALDIDIPLGEIYRGVR
jgi:Uma2 family endonuclease